MVLDRSTGAILSVFQDQMCFITVSSVQFMFKYTVLTYKLLVLFAQSIDPVFPWLAWNYLENGFFQLVKNLSTNKGKDKVYEQLNDFKDHDNRTAQVETEPTP